MSRAFESQRYNRGGLVTSFCVKLSLEIMSAIYDLLAVERRRQTGNEHYYIPYMLRIQ